MKTFLAYLVLIVGSVGALLLALTSYNDSQATRIHAQAVLVAQQSQSRLDLSVALMPYTILGLVLIGMVLMTSLIVFAIIQTNRPQPTPPIIERIETRTIVLIAPGQTKREVLKLLGGPK